MATLVVLKTRPSISRYGSIIPMNNHLQNAKYLHVQQVLEGFEIILGWETRNKYRILDENKEPIAYAAEQSKGIFSSIMRQFFDHWRAFTVTIFNQQRQPEYLLNFPFRWFFKTLYVSDASGKPIGKLEQRFAIFRKKFDVYDQHEQLMAKINSSFFKFWTFDFYHHDHKIGSIQKKWSGALVELFTDKDNFVVTFNDLNLSVEMKALMMSTCLMVDIIYFENNVRKGGVLKMFD
jgi:uncharacterized protein YxjI